MTSIYLPPWRVDIFVRDGARLPLSRHAAARAASRALEAAGAPAPAALSLTFTDDAEIAALNVEHMGHAGPTDVLSFPLLPPEAFAPHPGKARAGARAAAPFVAPPGRLLLGDIVISVERAREQAEQGRGGQTGDVAWSVTDEVRLLIVHGTLHICGWDHAEPLERDAMRAVENELLNRQTPRATA